MPRADTLLPPAAHDDDREPETLRGAALQSDLDALRETVRGHRRSSSPMRAAPAEPYEPFMKAR